MTSASVSGITLLASDRLALSLGDTVMLGASDHGDIEMSDTPDGSLARISLFQTDSRAVRATAFANWSLIAPSDSSGSKGVVVLSGATYG